ncbi:MULTISPECIES: DUF202 domain-containing protein [Pectobacterium]|nr:MULTISPECIES: DUF202 domain-containing protein [Pectobacterium]QPI44449.1 DUF202 domain-containing protein [Pectobacterium aroidearum]UUE46448.1 DUF202 domain-containing protein [Pectobacterium aroidearum]UUE50669.1 DUF202 domain-containing protein [Pectobacterium aroidearum]UUE54874.1 DUF202 domain-containing protein [Pectobacterium aroidearum]UUE63282.1 DUF202 domain-containing protein [Pectobacterium aroidearum]
METTRDPGLQPQRTGMAWSRTLFVMLINSLLCFRLSIVDDSRAVFACAILLLFVAALMSVLAILRYRFNACCQSVLSRASQGLIVLTSSSIVLTALVLLLHFSGVW